MGSVYLSAEYLNPPKLWDPKPQVEQGRHFLRVPSKLRIFNLNFKITREI